MAKKAPRRTAERIAVVTLELFNRFGEPNVSTTLISAELNISPGILYYHYPAKDELINALFTRFDAELADLLMAADDVRNVEDAWLFFHMMFELIWKRRSQSPRSLKYRNRATLPRLVPKRSKARARSTPRQLARKSPRWRPSTSSLPKTPGFPAPCAVR